jgi:hypothetical protein
VIELKAPFCFSVPDFSFTPLKFTLSEVIHRSYSDVLFTPHEKRPCTRNAGDIQEEMSKNGKVTPKQAYVALRGPGG